MFGYEIRKIPPPPPPPPLPPANLPESHLYQPHFSPWLARDGAFARTLAAALPQSLVSLDRCWVLYCLARQALGVPGDFWECGVYKGGTAALFRRLLNEAQSPQRLYLFDTFSGMPATSPTLDIHKAGDFSDTSLAAVKAFLQDDPRCEFRPGFIPETFRGLESHAVAFAHIDVDIYQSVLDSTDFIWPRLSPGGFMIFDDYGFPTCPGARKAVDEFFRIRSAVPLSLATGQAIVFKSR